VTEDEARARIVERYGSIAAERVATFLHCVATENAVQNLISPASISEIWARHAVDSEQLLDFAPAGWKNWLDVGTGGGFPGMIVALLGGGTVTMVEPRRKRATFLQQCVVRFGLDARVEQAKVEALAIPADVISARAVSSVENLLHAAAGCATKRTTWLLPRGRSIGADLATLPHNLAMFHVEHSITDPESSVLVIRGNGS
jgi:16S rRNA (guanine527-N7)-methyltransferase